MHHIVTKVDFACTVLYCTVGILKILGSLDKMMAKCDIDRDGAIGIDYDMSHNGETCLATCFKRRAFKAAFFPDCDAGASSI